MFLLFVIVMAFELLNKIISFESFLHDLIVRCFPGKSNVCYCYYEVIILLQ